jgi:hypothetical protein
MDAKETVGVAVSITIFLLKLRLPNDPGAGKVKVALFPTASRIVALLKASAVVDA